MALSEVPFPWSLLIYLLIFPLLLSKFKKKEVYRKNESKGKICTSSCSGIFSEALKKLQDLLGTQFSLMTPFNYISFVLHSPSSAFYSFNDSQPVLAVFQFS